MTEFERFFQDDFPQLLAAVKTEPGLFTAPSARLEDASWDRKAAYLVWIEKRKPPMPAEEIEGLLV